MIIDSHITLDELNEFCACFEALNTKPLGHELASRSTLTPPFVVSFANVVKTLKKINHQKAVGPDNIPERACSSMLAGVFGDTFNLSLLKASIHTCFKTTTIISLSEK